MTKRNESAESETERREPSSAETRKTESVKTEVENIGKEGAEAEKTKLAGAENMGEESCSFENPEGYRQQLFWYQKELKESREQISELLKKLDFYEKETARLERQNEVLHETAWELINRVRTLEGRS